MRALLSDCGAETLLRNHLKRHGVAQKTIQSKTGKTTLLYAGPQEGQPVFCLHGTPGSALSWWSWLKNPGGFRIIALDRPGFSPENRSAPDPERDMPILAQALMESATERPAIIVGHSMGGGLAARLVLERPGNVKTLVLIGASLDPDLEEIKPVQYMARKAPLKYLLNRSARNSNEELIAYPEFIRKLAPDLAAITCPSLAVHARDDRLVPFANVDFMRKTMTGTQRFETLIYDQGGHGIHAIKRNEILKAIAGRV